MVIGLWFLAGCGFLAWLVCPAYDSIEVHAEAARRRAALRKAVDARLARQVAREMSRWS